MKSIYNALDEQYQIPLTSLLVSISKSIQHALEEEVYIPLEFLLVSIRNSTQHALEQDQIPLDPLLISSRNSDNMLCKKRTKFLYKRYWVLLKFNTTCFGGITTKFHVSPH
jgi:hypothetical protein